MATIIDFLKKLRPLAWRIGRSNFGRLSHPFKLTFSITWQCNSRCTFCSIWKKEPVRELTAREIGEFFLRNHHFSWIDLTGGEVFLRPDLVEICRHIKDRCPDLLLLHMPTNGLMPDRIVETVARIKNLGFPKLIFSVSLDGPPELHDRLRGVPEGWSKAVETYRKLKALGVETYFGLTLTDENLDQIDETVSQVRRFVPDFDWRGLHLNIAHHSAHYYGNEDAQIKSDLAKIEQVVSRFRKRRGFSLYPVFVLEDVYLKNIPRYLKTKKTPRPCQALSGSFFLDPEGNVYPCSIYDKKVGGLRQAGFDLQKIWQSPAAVGLQKTISSGGCPHCWTPCESYQGILGSLWRRPGDGTS